MNPASFTNCFVSLERKLPITIFAFSVMTLGVCLAGYSESAKAKAASAGSCNNEKMGFCNEFTGSFYKEASVQRSCATQKVKYVPGACPAKNRVGACLVYKGKDSESNYVYYTNFPGMRLRDGATVTSEAAKQCASLKGEWHPN